jgi:hypothetical protein
MTNYETQFKHLAEFLADTEAMPLEAVITELQSADVNVTQFVAEVKALADEPPRSNGIFRVVGDLAQRSKDELMKLLEELESGPFGAGANSPLPAAARTRGLSRLSNKELRERIGKLQGNRTGDGSNQPADKV